MLLFKSPCSRGRVPLRTQEPLLAGGAGRSYSQLGETNRTTEGIHRPYPRRMQAHVRGPGRGEVDVRGAISRVLSSPQGGGRPFLWDLGRPRPRTIYPGGLNGAGRHRSSPIRSFSGWGLPCHFRHRKRGALLPHRFTLAARSREVGGLFSVALSLGLRPVGVTNHPDPWSPDFPPPADARRRHEERPLGLSHPPPA